MLLNPTSDNQIPSTGRITGDYRRDRLPPIPSQIYLLVGIVGLLITSLVGYGFYTGYRISTTYAPLIDATMEIKLEATAAQLSLDQTLHRQNNQDDDEVLRHVEEAMWYLRAMLQGGTNFEGTFVPVPEEELFQSVKQAHHKFVQLKAMTLQRLRLAANHRSNDALDRDLDTRFGAFIKQVDQIETRLQKLMSQSLNRFRIAQAVLIIACISFALFTGIYFRRYEQHRRNAYRDLTRSHAQLENEIAKRKIAEAKVQAAHDDLEMRVEERTQDLGMVNERLAREVKERRRVEKNLINHQSRLRTLSSELSLSEERERRRIAQALHDGIGQNLSALAMNKLSMLRKPECQGFHEGLDAVSDMVRRMIEQTRLLIFELAPPSLYELGFVAAVEELIDKFKTQHGMRIEFHGDASINIDDEGVRAFLFQSVRELLSNIVQHAQADSTQVKIRKEGRNIRIDVQDDGIGFNTAEANAASGNYCGLGIFQIHERLQYLGGALEFNSDADQGSHAVLVAPMK